jgi:DNA polymerase-3 subunit alpha
MAKILSINELPETKIEQATAGQIFDLVSRFASYGFNKSHAAAYAIIAYRTGWLRRHHPEEFFAACMNTEMDNVEKLAAFYREAKNLGLTILPPDINASKTRFTVEKKGNGKAIRYALAGIRGVGSTAMDEILAERKKGGPFKSFHDLVRRTGGMLNRRGYESLIKAGALDSLHANRAEMLAGLEVALKEAQSDAKSREIGQASLFDGFLEMPTEPKLPSCPEMAPIDKLQAEFDTLGLYLTGHPITAAKKRLAYVRAKTIAQVLDANTRIQGDVKLGGLLNKIQIKSNRRNEPMGICLISDDTGVTEAVAFSDEFGRIRTSLRQGEAYIFTIGVGERDGERRLFIRGIEPLPLDPGLE